jgi:WD40 repeat protein
MDNRYANCDEYGLRYLPLHLIRSGRQENVTSLLFDFDFLQAKVSAVGPQPLIEDYIVAQAVGYGDPAQSLVRDALQLSAHVLVEDATLLWSQLYSRLMSVDSPDIQTLLANAPQEPWPRPLRSTVTQAGGPLLRTLEGHAGSILAVAVTPDGEKIVSASVDNTLKLWDLHTGEELRTLEGHTDLVTAVVVAAEGRHAVSGSYDGTLKVWDLETGEMLHSLDSHEDAVDVVLVTSNGYRVVSGSWDNTLRVWDIESGKELYTLEGHTDSVHAAAVTTDGKRAVSGSAELKIWDLETGKSLYTIEGGWLEPFEVVAVTLDGKHIVSGYDESLKIWDLESGEELRTLEGHEAELTALALLPDGRRVVSASLDKTLKIWDLGTGNLLRSLENQASGPDFVAVSRNITENTVSQTSVFTSGITALEVTADGRWAISAIDNDLTIWDLERGEKLCTLEGHTEPIDAAVALTPDGRYAVSGSGDATLKVWDLLRCQATPPANVRTRPVNTVKPSSQHTSPSSGDGIPEIRALQKHRTTTAKAHQGAVNQIAVTSNGQRAISASEDGTLKIWDLESGEELHTLEGHTSSVDAMAVSFDNQHIVSISRGKTTKVWNLETGEELHTLDRGFRGSAPAGVVTPDSSLILGAFDFQNLQLWNLKTGEELLTLEGHRSWVRRVALTPDGRYAVSASSDKTLKIWDLENGRELGTLHGHTGAVYNVLVTPDGRCAVSASSDETLKIWDLQTGKDLRTLAVHMRGVSMSLTPDGRQMVTNSSDDTLKIWDLATGTVLSVLQGHKDSVKTLTVALDGRYAVSGSADKTLRVWNLTNGETIASYRVHDPLRACDAAMGNSRIVAGDSSGQVHILHLENAVFDPPIVTALRLWLHDPSGYGGRWVEDILAICPWTGKQFQVAGEILDVIGSIARQIPQLAGQSPCLKLPPEAWHSPNLLSQCPCCSRPLRFNPFVVDNMD